MTDEVNYGALIYIVDDDESMRVALVSHLKKAGFSKMKGFEHGDGLCDLLDGLPKEEHPVLTIMDTEMDASGGRSHIPGFMVCEELKKQYGHIGVIGNSGRQTYEDKWIKNGADYFWHKKIDSLPELIEKTKELVLKYQ